MPTKQNELRGQSAAFKSASISHISLLILRPQQHYSKLGATERCPITFPLCQIHRSSAKAHLRSSRDEPLSRIASHDVEGAGLQKSPQKSGISFNTPPFPSLQETSHYLYSSYASTEDHSLLLWVIPSAQTMPGVPSGKGCDACRKQKKKVRQPRVKTS